MDTHDDDDLDRELDDLDAFIAGIEQTAPDEPQVDSRSPVCEECGTALEQQEDSWVCSNCSAEARNIVQLEQSEMFYTEDGRLIAGHGVRTVSRRNRMQQIDYGFAWSTDEAIFHLLQLQAAALERLQLVPRDTFRTGLNNMWVKYWCEHVAMFIKDEYTEADYVPLLQTGRLKYRDLEVLLRRNDKLMLPNYTTKSQNKVTRSFGMSFHRIDGLFETNNNALGEDSDDSSLSSLRSSPPPTGRKRRPPNQPPPPPPRNMNYDQMLDMVTRKNYASHTRKKDNVTVLTLDRTLAFLDATAKLVCASDPLLTADIVRACAYQLVPYFGAHKSLPETMKLSQRDVIVFARNHPPSTDELNIATSNLLSKIYQDRLPFQVPAPDLTVILKRFVHDMNLPLDLLNYIIDGLDFSSFKQTTNPVFKDLKKQSRFPIYERWAFIILIALLKKVFVLDDDSLEESGPANENDFCLREWICQLATRLQLIMSYDPYVLFHPMADIRQLQPTPQVHNYISSLLQMRVNVDIRRQAEVDRSNFEELTYFVKRGFPKPNMNDRFQDEQYLEKPKQIKYPIRDAFERTRRFWEPELEGDKASLDYIFKDYSGKKVVVSRADRHWTIPREDFGNLKLILPTGEVKDHWPYCLKLLMDVGAYLCFCRPKDLLYPLFWVQQYIYPQRTPKKRGRKVEK